MKKYMVLMGTLVSMTILFVSYSWGQIHAPIDTAANRSLYAGTSCVGTPPTFAPAFVPWVEDPYIWDTFIFQILSPQPLNGTAAVVNNKLVYTPKSNFLSGIDNFTYNVTDQGGATITGIAKVRVYGEGAYSICTRNSTVNSDGTLNTLTRSNRCTFYTITDTRVTDTGTQVTMDYFINWPSSGSAPKALVVLIGGKDLNMEFAGDTTTGVANPTTGGGNFVVRTAQLFADAGYLTVAINRPSDLPDSIAAADSYRISVKHAVDILTVLKHVNTENLDVFLVGTSCGAISAVASNLIAAGVSLSSPVTSASVEEPSHLYIGRSGIANLQPSFVKRPVHVLWNVKDECSLSKPADSQTLYNSLSSSTTAANNIASGGVRVTTASNGIEPNICGPFDYHGYFGIEREAVGYITNWLNAQVLPFAGSRPQAAFVTVTTPPGVSKQINLDTLTTGQNRVYALSHTETSLDGSSVTLNGPTVTYIPPAGVNNKTDYFVYVVTDGNGRVGAAVITVRIGIPPAPPSGLRIIH
jgi:hypothetical protein